MTTGIRAQNERRVRLKSEDEPVPMVPVVAEGRGESLRADHSGRSRSGGSVDLLFWAVVLSLAT